jgi:two-component sensor histidine kinase
MPTIQELCSAMTDLTPEEINEVIRIESQLQVMADLYGSDVFIDCLVKDRIDQAVVVAHAQPETGPSLYSSKIVGQPILRDNEPGVFYCFSSGEYITGTRAITNETVTVEQKVLPVKSSSGKVICVIILEQDISRQVIQEQAVQLFRETAVDLGETLWEVAVAETNLPSLIHEGVILCNSEYLFTYMNPTARSWFEKVNLRSPEVGSPLSLVCFGVLDQLMRSAYEKGVEAKEFSFGDNVAMIKAISIRRGQQFKGGLILLTDVTELREKEKQLMIKSAVIKEIHHRVKNNLQTISSLLRLQMRRTTSEEIRDAFKDSIHRIKTIALVHETLSQTGIDSIELNGLVIRIVSMLIQTSRHPETDIQFDVSGDSVILLSEQATPVALVINELVQNCLDHAFNNRASGSIHIHVERATSEVLLRIQDDGTGIDLGSVEEGNTLGTRIVRTLVVEDLGGDLRYEVDGGTRVVVRFPYRSE